MTKNLALRVALALSLLLNVGVLGAAAWRALAWGEAQGDFPGFSRYLQLTDDQQRRWREAEAAFLEPFRVGASEIHERRDRLITAIFADDPDAAAIEAERAAIARLQSDQQRLVIEQLLREREMLDAEQRRRLAQLLSSQPAGASTFEQLHRD